VRRKPEQAARFQNVHDLRENLLPLGMADMVDPIERKKDGIERTLSENLERPRITLFKPNAGELRLTRADQLG
jgi:hypothetical protein